VIGVIRYEIEPQISDQELNHLFHAAWKSHEARTFSSSLKHSLTYLCAFDGAILVGFVNLAWDGGLHGFVLDTTVHRNYQRRGIGTEMIRNIVSVAYQRGIQWIHVDFEPYLEPFYRKCGFKHTEAGLLNLDVGLSKG
jgi:GNAT superfamily N-acetyltransferase